MRVLVGEDVVCRQIVQAIVENRGHRVLASGNGRAARELIVAEGADVIMSDWQIPGLNGLDLRQKTRNHPEVAYPYFIVAAIQAPRCVPSSPTATRLGLGQ